MLAGRSVVVGRESRISRGPQRRRPKIFRIARRPIRSINATCPASRGSCIWNIRSRYSRRRRPSPITFEWSLVLSPDLHGRHTAPRRYRYLDGRFARPLGWRHAGGGCREYNDKTWFDMAGDFHSDALHVVERYRMTGPDTIQYEATIEDSKVFTKPWTISIPLHRRADRDRLFEYNCQDEVEEANGAFPRREKNVVSGRWNIPSCNGQGRARRSSDSAGSAWQTSAGRLTTSRICRASGNHRLQARTRGSKAAVTAGEAAEA